jgi:5-bromo-4-chloroindolyl phosphate hydrolysis protein
MLFSAAAGRKKEAKFKRCLNVTGTSGLVNMDHVSETLGMDFAQTDKLLSEMIDRGYYGAKAYLDHQRKLLVIDPQDMRDVYRAEDETKKSKAESEAKAGETEYDRIIEEIRQADVDIEDEAMSEKIRRMQAITASIFEEVKEHPEKKPQIQRFMDYYLPTTLKLLSSYAHIEAQGVSGDNMAKAKADIERIADTLVQGYEKQLDTLYQAEAVDIAGDVSVIENMMKRDGLAAATISGRLWEDIDGRRI